MGALGTVGEAVNAKKLQVFIGSTDNEWRLMQNARILISHPIFREPTTNGGVVTYTGAPDNSISGTLLFTRDEWTTANALGVGEISGLKALLSSDGLTGEVLSKTWVIKMTDVSGSSVGTTLTFTNCKLSVADISKSVEGAVKVDITVVCPDEPT